jgi:hypothetical protein
MMTYTKSGYLDPIHIVWRAGTSEDPYVDRIEYLKVVNHKIVLSEIPDSFYRVRISGMNEVNTERIDTISLAENEFHVNYSSGIIQVHEKQEANTLNIIYKGRGFIQYPSNRIYHQDKMNDVVMSLEEIIDKSFEKVDEAVDYLKESIDGKISDYQQIRTELVTSLDDIKEAIDEAQISASEADLARDKALDASETTKLVFKPFVNKFSNITTAYPNPKVGWTTQVYETGIRYRFDGAIWQPIDLFGGNIAVANQNLDGLMSKDDKKKVDEISNDVNIKTMVFVVPNNPSDGIGHIFIRFPHQGEILDVSAFCAFQGTGIDTIISVQKSRDMVTWNSVLNPNLTIKKNNYFNDNLHAINTTTVAKDDIFRLDFKQVDDDISDITIQVKVKIQ